MNCKRCGGLGFTLFELHEPGYNSTGYTIVPCCCGKTTEEGNRTSSALRHMAYDKSRMLGDEVDYEV